MRTMIDLGNQRGRHGGYGIPVAIMDSTPTSVDCGREVRFRRSLRSLVECMVPCCGFLPNHHSNSVGSGTGSAAADSSSTLTASSVTTLTGTFFGYRKGRVSFCLQDHSRSTSPFLLLEFTVPTAYLAREMQYGLLRIALECHRDHRQMFNDRWLLNVPVWSMYCNGRKVGFAIRRQVTVTDNALLNLMQSVSVGAGVIPPHKSHHPPPPPEDAGDLMYLRATFERVIGSADSESFHMINPDGSSAQELSIFLFRSS